MPCPRALRWQRCAGTKAQVIWARRFGSLLSLYEYELFTHDLLNASLFCDSASSLSPLGVKISL